MTFGKEPILRYGLLKPVFTKFVETFDDSEWETSKDLWQKTAHYSGGGSGPRYLSWYVFHSPEMCILAYRILLYRTHYSILLLECTREKSHINGRNPSSEDMMRCMDMLTPVISLDGTKYYRSMNAPFIKF